MPYVLFHTYSMTGSGTTRGADVAPWTQHGADPYWRLNGSGSLVPATPVSASYFVQANTLFDCKVEFDFSCTFEASTVLGLIGRAVSPFTDTGPGSTALDIYWNRLSGNGVLSIFHGNAAVEADTEGSWSPVSGTPYTGAIEMRTGSAGQTKMFGRVGLQSAPGIWLASTNSGVGDGSILDSTVNLNDSGGTYLFGIAGQPSGNTPSDLAITAVRLYQWVEDTTGPVLGTLVIPESGSCGRIPVIDTPNYNPPVLPPTGVTGLSFRRSQDSGATWQSFATTGPITISQDTAYPGRIEFAFASTVLATDEIDYSYDPGSGNITDSNVSPNAAGAVTHSLGLNHSLYDPAAASRKSTMILGDRGFARTSADTNDAADVEVQTSWMQTLPYGASKGWKVAYLGYSDGTNETIAVKAAAVWVQATPDEPRIKIPLTFGGSSTVNIAAGVIQESDGVQIDVRPGSRVWGNQWYRSTLNSGSAGQPFCSWLYVRELVSAGAEDCDGILRGAIGSMTDHTIIGGFDHTSSPPNVTAAYIARGWGPTAIVGHPHPSFTGTEVVPCWIGDSTNVQFTDTNDDQTPMMARGFNGRFCFGRYPMVVLGQAGSVSGGFRALEGGALWTYLFGAVGGVGRKVTHVPRDYGLNGAIRTNTGIAGGAANDEWGQAGLDATLTDKYGCKFVMGTIGTFAAGDVPGGNDYATATAQRLLFNNMVRNQWHTLTGCVGFTDPASLVEFDFINGTNLYYTGGAGQLHEDTPGHVLWARAIRPSVFEGNPNPITAGRVRVTQDGADAVLDWDADPNALHYLIWRSPTGAAPWAEIGIVAAPVVTYTDVAPVALTNWYFVVPVPY